MNTIYIDANRGNSNQKDNEFNEWTTKLNTPLELPKGTSIQIQNSFINQKGITGGSIEIDEDISEVITYCFYVNEIPHFQPIAHGTHDFKGSYYRSTLNCHPKSFVTNFTAPVDEVQAGGILTGYGFTDDEYRTALAEPQFAAYGGCAQILPHVELFRHTDGNYYLRPKVFELEIFVPKGIYGIGELAQLIEDQMNGVRVVIKSEITGEKLVLDREETRMRLQDVEAADNSDVNERFDGQPFNRPFMRYFSTLDRDYNTSIGAPPPELNDFFTNMESFVELIEYSVFTSENTEEAPNKRFRFDTLSGNLGIQYANTRPFPLYNLRPPYQRVTTGAGDDQWVQDPDITLRDYWRGPYNENWDANAGGIPPANEYKTLVGTGNFTFNYDQEKNGFSIGGLHNQIRGASHDRFMMSNESSGQSIINFKKVRRGAPLITTMGTPAGRNAYLKVISALNTPQTRDMGVMIINFARTTADRLRNNLGTTLFNKSGAQFPDFFTNVSQAKKAWEETLWAKLGFSYEQLVDSEFFERQNIYNRGQFGNWGFTTNEKVDNGLINTISNVQNPLQVNIAAAKKGDDPIVKTNFQMFNLNNFAVPYSVITDFTGANLVYAGSLGFEYSSAPVILASVGGITAKNLPQLSKNPYFLITCDVCDNFKDNVKNGDVLPLLGIVAKSSLSNQDFITSENQIVQVISNTKVINSIKIKVLNPDLTSPSLSNNSSVLIKITRPNIIPTSLLEQENPKIAKEIVGESQTY